MHYTLGSSYLKKRKEKSSMRISHQARDVSFGRASSNANAPVCEGVTFTSAGMNKLFDGAMFQRKASAALFLASFTASDHRFA